MRLESKSVNSSRFAVRSCTLQLSPHCLRRTSRLWRLRVSADHSRSTGQRLISHGWSTTVSRSPPRPPPAGAFCSMSASNSSASDEPNTSTHFGRVAVPSPARPGSPANSDDDDDSRLLARRLSFAHAVPVFFVRRQSKAIYVVMLTSTVSCSVPPPPPPLELFVSSGSCELDIYLFLFFLIIYFYYYFFFVCVCVCCHHCVVELIRLLGCMILVLRHPLCTLDFLSSSVLLTAASPVNSARIRWLTAGCPHTAHDHRVLRTPFQDPSALLFRCRFFASEQSARPGAAPA